MLIFKYFKAQFTKISNHKILTMNNSNQIDININYHKKIKR